MNDQGRMEAVTSSFGGYYKAVSDSFLSSVSTLLPLLPLLLGIRTVSGAKLWTRARKLACSAESVEVSPVSPRRG